MEGGGGRERTLAQVQLGQRYRMRGTEENIDSGTRFHSTGRAEGARDQSYPLTIGMEGEDNESFHNEVVKGFYCRA